MEQLELESDEEDLLDFAFLDLGFPPEMCGMAGARVLVAAELEVAMSETIGKLA